jgi:hypothetical protein
VLFRAEGRDTSVCVRVYPEQSEGKRTSRPEVEESLRPLRSVIPLALRRYRSGRIVTHSEM